MSLSAAVGEFRKSPVGYIDITLELSLGGPVGELRDTGRVSGGVAKGLPFMDGWVVWKGPGVTGEPRDCGRDVREAAGDGIWSSTSAYGDMFDFLSPILAASSRCDDPARDDCGRFLLNL